MPSPKTAPQTSDATRLLTLLNTHRHTVAATDPYGFYLVNQRYCGAAMAYSGEPKPTGALALRGWRLMHQFLPLEPGA